MGRKNNACFIVAWMLGVTLLPGHQMLFANEKIITDFKLVSADEARSQRISLIDFLKDDSNQLNYLTNRKNRQNARLPLVEQYPALFLSAAQYAYAVVLSQGTMRKTLLGAPESIITYNLFNTPMKANGDAAVFGNDKSMSSVVEIMKNAATNMNAGLRIPLLVGVPGTGKSQFLSILQKTYEIYSRNQAHSEFHSFELAFDLKAIGRDIPSVTSFTKLKMLSDIYRSQTHSSPIAAFPEDVQNFLLSKAITGKMSQLYKNGPEKDFSLTREHFNIPLDIDPTSKFLLNAIMSHAKNEKINFNDTVSVVEYLSKYVFALRYVLDKDTIISFAPVGNEEPLGDLLMTENPLIKNTAGSEHPLAYTPGKLLRGNRGIVYFDEYFRSCESFTTKTLEFFGNRTVTYSGSITYPIDIWFLIASNQESIRSDVSAALMQRIQKLRWDMTIHPYDTAKVLVYGLRHDLRMKALDSNTRPDFDPSLLMDDENSVHSQEAVAVAHGEDDQAMETNDENNAGSLMKRSFSFEDMHSKQKETKDYTRINFAALFGDGQNPDSAHSHWPHGHYALKHRNITIAPWVIEFLSSWASATRWITDVKKAQELKLTEQLLENPIFRTHLSRLNALLQEPKTDQTKYQALYRLQLKLQEGMTGITPREINTFFALALKKATENPDNQQTITVTLLKEVFEEMIIENQFEDKNIGPETISRWRSIWESLQKGWLIKKYNKDILEGINKNDQIDAIYKEIVLELTALSNDENAKEYENQGKKTLIQFDRLKAISKIYEDRFKKKLDFKSLMQFLGERINIIGVSSVDSKSIQDENLRESIASWQEEGLSRFAIVDGILGFMNTNRGKTEDKENYRTMSDYLSRRYGYNNKAIHDALQIVKISNQQKNNESK